MKQGMLFESLNLAAAGKLPVLFVCKTVKTFQIASNPVVSKKILLTAFILWRSKCGIKNPFTAL